MHVCMILEAPSLKDDSGKELRHLHDTVQQHIRALKAMDYEPSGPFITSYSSSSLMLTQYSISKGTARTPLMCLTIRNSLTSSTFMLKPPRHLSPTTRNHFEVNGRHQKELPSKQVDSFLCHEYHQSLCSVSNWQTPALCLQEVQVYVTWPNGIYFEDQ